MENNYSYKHLEFDIYNNYKIKDKNIKIRIENNNSKIGVLLVGIGGNNGSTLVTSLLAYKKGLTWENKNGIHNVNFLGSIYEYGSINLGYNKEGKIISKLMKDMAPFKNPKDIIIGGWDICKDNLYECCKKNKVIEPQLYNQLKDDLINIIPMKSIYYENFIAQNQKERSNNYISTYSKWNDVLNIVSDITKFKLENNLDNVIVIWTASTEKQNKCDTYKNTEELFEKLKQNDINIPPSIIFATATIISEGIVINTSPQNTIISPILELAKKYGTFVAGNDLKSGQTKLKSVLIDYIASSGLRPLSIVSYNHLGNNDGLNLKEKPQFNSKEITKRGVIDDIIDENPILIKEKPEHLVDIRYIKSVGDSKRAIDEYYSELMLDGRNTLSINNICEDSLLAVPILLDIILFTDLFSRTSFLDLDTKEEYNFSSNLSLLSFFFKAPIDSGRPIINSFFKQRYALENFIKACNGIPINDFLNLHNHI